MDSKESCSVARSCSPADPSRSAISKTDNGTTTSWSRGPAVAERQILSAVSAGFHTPPSRERWTSLRTSSHIRKEVFMLCRPRVITSAAGTRPGVDAPCRRRHPDGASTIFRLTWPCIGCSNDYRCVARLHIASSSSPAPQETVMTRAPFSPSLQ